jgi:hypothetical protein
MLVTGLATLYGALRREIRSVEQRSEARADVLDAKIDALHFELRTDIGRLDDRVYALATGLRPTLDQGHHPD